MAKASEMTRAQWNDPRTVEFRAVVKGWAFSTPEQVLAKIERAKPYAWLPVLVDQLNAMADSAEREMKEESR